VTSLQQGRIIWVEMDDEAGTNRKKRPAVIVTRTDEIVEDKPFTVAAVTSSFDEPLPNDAVKLAWARDGRCVTKLNRPTVVRSTWLADVMPNAEIEFGGVVPPTIMLEVLRRLPKSKQNS
jgi:hypothetical protein